MRYAEFGEVAAVNYSDMRQELARHLRECATMGKRFQIMRNGKAEGVLISAVEWEQILETLAILTDPKMMEQLIGGEEDIRLGRVRGMDEVFGELLKEEGNVQGGTDVVRRRKSQRAAATRKGGARAAAKRAS